jgi:glycosyltransferase involved in cell wall biosynthesis
MKVLHVVSSFWPATSFGGPIFSTKAVCDGISNIGVEVNVLTTDAESPGSSKRMKLTNRNQISNNGYRVFYCRSIRGVSFSFQLLLNLPRAMLNADVIHLTGPYSFHVLPVLLLGRILSKPIVWSNRGGFQATHQWENVSKKRLKLLFEKISHACAHTNTYMHCTSDIEIDLGLKNFPKLRNIVIPNPVTPPSVDEINTISRELNKYNKQDFRILFLSRIHEKKGIENLLLAMKALPNNIFLDIYGDGDAVYVSKLKKISSDLGIQSKVIFHGKVSGHKKTKAFLDADLFCLPSHSENFGIVIAEALAHGLPVITTNNTPWKSLDEKGCGVCMDLSKHSLHEEIIKISMRDDIKNMGAKGQEWMKKDFSEEKIALEFFNLYKSISTL